MEIKELEEKISQHFGVPFIYSPEYKLYACQNGVWFKEDEFEEHKDDEDWLQKEFIDRQKQEDFPLVDYDRLKNTGVITSKPKFVRPHKENPIVEKSKNKIDSEHPVDLDEQVSGHYYIPRTEPIEWEPVIKKNLTAEKSRWSVKMICAALGLVSIVSMYISTVHTATYLFDYVDLISAWLMSAVITIYSSTAFEVVILFHEKRRHILSVIFAFLWALVITFSMVTTVSVFYDRFNFATLEIAEENSKEDGSRLALEVLKNEEASIKEAIKFKQEEIEYRRSKEYATHTRTLELDALQKDLQENLKSQKEILQEMPNASKEAGEVHRKETLFAFLGRLMNIEGGVLEFIMSTLSAIFVNLISPLSLTVVVSLTGGKKDEDNH